MNTPVSATQPPVATGSLATEVALRNRIYQWVWRVESVGLLALTVMTFFPAWSHVQEYLFLSLFVIGYATAYGQGRQLLYPSTLNLPIALWLGWIVLSVPFALDPVYSFGEWRKVIVKVLWFYWTMLILRNTEYDEMDGKVLVAVAVGSLVLCSYALLDFMSRDGMLSDRLIRARAPSSDYNWLSSYLVMAIPILMAGALRVRRHLSWTVFYLGTSALALTALLLSYTRAGWLALLSQGCAFGIFTKRIALIVGFLAGSVIMLSLILAVGVGEYHQDTRDLWTVQSRAAVWALMLQDIKEHPLFGVGYGTETFMRRFGDRPETVKTKGSHNFFLMTAMGSGFPALAFLAWVFLAGITECLRAARTFANHSELAALWMGLALMIVGVAVRNLFDTMFVGSLACLFWMLLGTGLGKIPRWQRSQW